MLRGRPHTSRHRTLLGGRFGSIIALRASRGASLPWNRANLECAQYGYPQRS
jgi:hypothetical protein